MFFFIVIIFISNLIIFIIIILNFSNPSFIVFNLFKLKLCVFFNSNNILFQIY
jgi:hypothetical protein